MIYSFVVYFVLSIVFVLTLASVRAVLDENIAFSILVLSTKTGYSSFLKRAYFFQKIGFKVKILKTFKIFSHSHINRGVFKRSQVPFFRRTYALSVGFKRKPLRKSIFLNYNKNPTQIFP